MSRICVKNLPKYVAEDRLKEFFSQKGEVTDAKLMRTQDGKSRQFAFIGFRTERESEEALKFFNNSFLDNSRLTCEVARKVGDPNMPRPWSRYSATKQEKVDEENRKNIGSKSLSHVDTKGNVQNSKRSSENDDPQLQEFLQVMQPRIKSKLWANDSVGVPLLEPNGKAGTKQKQKQKKKQMDEADGQQSGSNHLEYDEIDKSENGSSNAHAAKQSGDAINDEVVSDMDYFKSRVKRQWSDSESDDDSPIEKDDQGSKESDMEEQCDANQNEAPKDKVKKEASSENSDGEGDLSSRLKDAREEVLETGRLFVRNLPYSATEDDLAELFSKFGNVSQVHIVVDKDTKRSKGIAYVLYTIPESALRALEELDNSIFQGRLLHIMPAKQQNPSEKQQSSVAAGQTSKTFKQKREEQKKASEASGGDTQAWNSLFMRPDTVVENIARTLGVNKSDLLDREADDLAVRIALGETQVIAETKNALNNAGVNVAALEGLAVEKTVGTGRSNHVLLVKNLPYGSSEGDLAKMFGKFGSLDKIIFPPTKTLALIVFLEAAEARAAFKGLAYKRYKDAPLYLEWAPNDILSLSATSETKSHSNVIVGEQDVKRVLLEQRVEGISEVDMDPDRVESRSLFVKNLNFKTSDEGLRKHFSENMKEGNIQSTKIKKHQKNGKTLSMGFGFIEFDSVETATNVCRDLQGTALDGHALILQLCHAKKDGQVAKKADKDRSSTKIIVRNVAFEATVKDLRQLFSPFGQINCIAAKNHEMIPLLLIYCDLW
ncbi:multiple RNA-binding domain-containing protein 1 isoform X2 [Macadamia integrifolia]|uniref:multiple RNA-binding domain-containing protein 1 isoform X2 n=1 Tax=Macadamia integrifolia TaxID=60698 RepID=UPI001C52E45F|nr:multiple RNA-binding domain-containing protein 1 isoform X2 [Macadamia integrifolia]